MEYRQLLYFCKIAELGSFSRAAAQLFVSQPALSKQILELEREYGVTLFVRGKRRVTLTERGQALLPKAQNVIAGMDEAEQILGGRRSDDGRKVFRIGVEEYMIDIPVVRKSFLTAEAALRRAFPNVLTDLVIRARSELEQRCERDELDVALITTHDLGSIRALRYDVFIQAPMCCYFSESMHSQMQAAGSLAGFLSAHTLIHLNDNPAMRTHIAQLLRAIQAQPRHVVTNGLAVALTRAQRAEGVLLLPETLLREEALDGLCVMPLDADLYPLYYAALHRCDSEEYRYFCRALQLQQ